MTESKSVVAQGWRCVGNSKEGETATGHQELGGAEYVHYLNYSGFIHVTYVKIYPTIYL